MAHDKVYGVCESKCFVETMSKEQLKMIFSNCYFFGPVLTGINNFNELFSTSNQNPTGEEKEEEDMGVLLRNFDTSFGLNFSQMFKNQQGLFTAPQLDLSNGLWFDSMFENCKNLVSVPEMDFSAKKTKAYSFYPDEIRKQTVGSDCRCLFKGCLQLKEIPNLDTEITKITEMFNNCRSLEEIPDLFIYTDSEGAQSVEKIFYQCISLKRFRDNPYAPEGKRWQFKENFSFGESPLERTSILKVFNGLQTVENKTITISSTTNSYLSDEDKQIATNKGWTIAVQ